MLREQIQKDFIEARKLRDTVRSNLLGTILAEVTKIEKSPQRVGKPPTDDDTIKVLKTFEVSIQEVLKLIPDQEKAHREFEIVKAYLPTNLTEEQLTGVIQEIIASGEKTIGSIIAALKKTVPNQYDGKSAAEIIKRLLA